MEWPRPPGSASTARHLLAARPRSLGCRHRASDQARVIPTLPDATDLTNTRCWPRAGGACWPFGSRELRRDVRSYIAALVTLAAVAAGTTGCSTASRGADELLIREITPPFLLSLEARDPAVTADAHGRVAITWVTPTASGNDVWLAVSRDGGETFGAPSRVNIASGRAVSSGEARPATAIGPDGTLAIAWS